MTRAANVATMVGVKKRSDYMFHYSDRYRSGAFDLRDVVCWESDGYDKYGVRTKNDAVFWLEREEFYRFEKAFNALEDDGGLAARVAEIEKLIGKDTID